MKPILALVIMLLFGQPLCAFAPEEPTVKEEPPAEQDQPAGKQDDAGANRDEQRPQPPPHLARVKRLTEAEKDGIVWGKAENGLAIGIGKINASLKSPMRPSIEVYLENRGTKTIDEAVLRRARFVLTFDEKKHSIPGLGTQVRLIESLEPGKRHGPVKLTADQFRVIQFLQIGAVVNRNRTGPELSEGIHTVQLDFVAQRPNEGPLQVSSQPVKLEVSLAPYPVERAVAMIRDGLNNKNLTVRRDSALLAGQLGLAACRDDLIRALKDNDLIVRKYACQSLGNLKDPAGIEPLKALLEDESLDLRLQAARSLTDLGLPLQPHWIEPIIKSQRTNEYQGAIMLAREKLGKKAVPILIRGLDFDDPSVRNHRNYFLVQQIGVCGGPRYTYYRNIRRTGGTQKQIAHNQRVLLDLKALVIEDL